MGKLKELREAVFQTSLMERDRIARHEFSQEWYKQGGSPEDSVFKVGTDVLRRLKKLEDGFQEIIKNTNR